MSRTVATYSLTLGLGAIALAWLQHRYWIRALPGEAYVTVIAVGCVAFGVWLARMLTPNPAGGPFARNEEAIRALRLSARELEVLETLARGDSNKEIARRLGISPHTVKTHIGRLCGKLEVGRRGQAVEKARQLALIP